MGRKNSSGRYLGDIFSEELKAVASFTFGALFALTVTSIVLTGIMGYLFLKVWNINSNSVWDWCGYGLLSFCGVCGTLGVVTLMACLSGFWLKVRRLLKPNLIPTSTP